MRAGFNLTRRGALCSVRRYRLLNNFLTTDNANQDDNDRNYQEDMNKATNGISGNHTDQPKYYENYCDGPQHRQKLKNKNYL